MHERDELEAAGRAALAPFCSQAEWIHRRVESLKFPSPDDLVIRRRLSFDFTIPGGLQRIADVPDAAFYVPLSVMRKWPPVIGLDLQSGGRDLPFLTRQQNDIIDFELLYACAQKLVGPEVVVGDLRAALEQVVRTDGQDARDAYDAVLAMMPSTDQGRQSDADDPSGLRPPRTEPDSVQTGLVQAMPRSVDAGNGEHDIDLDATFRRLVSDLTSNTILWVPVTGAPGERRIVVLSYDMRHRVRLFFYSPASFGFKAFTFGAELPHIGESGSYHLDVETPAPLRVVEARLRTYRRTPGRQDPSRDPDPFGPLNEDERLVRDTVIVHERADERHGTFYVSGDRDRLAVAFVRVLVEKEGYIRGALGASATITVVLAIFYLVAFRTVRRPGSDAVTALLFLPALLGYLVIQIQAHTLARAFLSGLRKAISVSTMLPVTAAITLVAEGTDKSTLVDGIWIALIATSGLITLLFALSSFLPWKDLAFPWKSRPDEFEEPPRTLGAHQLGTSDLTTVSSNPDPANDLSQRP